MTMLSELQRLTEDYEKDKVFQDNPDKRMVYLIEEIGEIATCLKGKKDNMAEELADALQHIIGFANYYGIDLELAYRAKKNLWQ